MAKAKGGKPDQPSRKPLLVWIHGEIKTPLMDTRKRKAIEAAGWKIGDAADFLEMSDEEQQLLDARLAT